MQLYNYEFYLYLNLLNILIYEKGSKKVLHKWDPATIAGSAVTVKFAITLDGYTLRTRSAGVRPISLIEFCTYFSIEA
jgi:hypothetical protein